MPASRPRSSWGSSGSRWLRTRPLIMSAAPARARQDKIAQMSGMAAASDRGTPEGRAEHHACRAAAPGNQPAVSEAPGSRSTPPRITVPAPEGVQLVGEEREERGGEGEEHRRDVDHIGADQVGASQPAVADEIRHVSDRNAYWMKRPLAREQGLLVGISAGANSPWRVRSRVSSGRCKHVVTVLCDTGERYFSLDEYF